MKGIGPPALLDALPALASTLSVPALRAGHSLQFPGPLCSSSRHQSSFLCHTILMIISTFFFIYSFSIFIFPFLFSVEAAVVVTVSLTFEENPPIGFQLLDDPR